VESLAGRGYRLAEGPRGVRLGELAGSLRTRVLGRAARHLEESDSTNREAERWATQGAPDGALVVAEHQVAGRGRLGRTWADLPGRSLLFSLILRPALAASRAPPLTFVAAISLAETLARWVPTADVEIKWPNDVLLRGRKAAGILLEMRTEGQAVQHVILGIGVNVEGSAEEFPADVRPTSTTVAAHATSPPTRLEVLCGFLEAFEGSYAEFQARGLPGLLPQWARWFRMAGRPIRVHSPRGIVEGRAVGLGPAGSLIVDPGDGQSPVEIFAGDVETSTTRDP